LLAPRPAWHLWSWPGPLSRGVAFLIDQLCSLGMLLTWLYAVNRVPGTRAVVYKPEGVVAERAAA